MKNFWLIFQYEIKKITHRKLWIAAFTTILFVTILLNLYTIFEFSVGGSGANLTTVNKYGRVTTDVAAFFNGVTIRYVNDSDELVEEKVSPLKYIRMQRQFAMKWSGKPIDDETINAMRTFIRKYNSVDDEGYSIGWSIQNYRWVFRTIYYMGLNPMSENLSEEFIRDNVERSRNHVYDAEQLTKEEKEYWSERVSMKYPLIMSYSSAYKEIINKAYWIHIMLILYVIMVLCDVCTVDRARRLHQIIRATEKGTNKAIVARLCAGTAIVVVSALILYILTAIMQFGLFGTDGFRTPIQQIGGLERSSLMISVGQAAILICLTSIILLAMIGAITMLLSELLQSSVGAILLPSVFLLFSLIFDRSIFDENRQISQLWQYFPLQRIREEMLYDERLVSIGNKLFTAIPFSITLYLVVGVLALIMCAGIAFVRKRDRR